MKRSGPISRVRSSGEEPGASQMNSSRARPVIGAPLSVAVGKCAVSRPSPGASSPCQPDHASQ